MKKFKPKIDITNECNLKCDYCYVKKENFSIVNINEINTFLNNIRQLNGYFDKECLLFGGEPSLAHNLINEILKNNKDFKFSIITNGYRLFYKKDLNFYKNFNNVTITLEGTEKAYNVLRGEKELKSKIIDVINLKKTGVRAEVNLSVNGLLNENIDEFIDNVHTLVKNNIYVHHYSIKGDNKFKSTEEYIYFLEYLKNNAKDIYENILMLNKDIEKVDSNYLCTYDERLTMSYNGELVNCSMGKKNIGNITDINTYLNIFNEIQENEVKNWKGCANCDVKVGLCNVSCPEYIKECFKKNKLEELNHVCEFERIKEYYRRKELNGN